MHWRVLLTPPLPGADNMALDEALLERARATGEAVARVYTWTRPTLSLGRNQTAAGCYDLALAARMGVDVVRRPTGGREADPVPRGRSSCNAVTSSATSKRSSTAVSGAAAARS